MSTATYCQSKELSESRERHHEGMAQKQNQPSLDDAIQRQQRAIREAKWCLLQGWPEKARKALDRV